MAATIHATLLRRDPKSIELQPRFKSVLASDVSHEICDADSFPICIVRGEGRAA